MNKGPVIYLEWVQCLDELEEGNRDDEVIAQLCNGVLPQTPVVSNRIFERLIDIIFERFQLAAHQFQQTLYKGFDEPEWMSAISLIRRRFTKAWQLSQLPFIPQEGKDNIVEQLEGGVKELQENIIRTFTENEPTGKLASFLRNNPVTLEKIPYQAVSELSN